MTALPPSNRPGGQGYIIVRMGLIVAAAVSLAMLLATCGAAQ